MLVSVPGDFLVVQTSRAFSMDFACVYIDTKVYI